MNIDQATEPVQQADEKKRQYQLMCRALAESVVNQLSHSGCDTGQLIEFATEVLDNVTNGKRNNSSAAAAGVVEKDHIQDIAWTRSTSAGSQPAVQGPRVSLRLLTVEDVPVLETWSNDDRIRKTFSLQLLTQLIASGCSPDEQRVDFMVCDERGHRIGLVCLFNIDKRIEEAEIAKLLGDPQAEGKGYAGEATRLVLAYAFDTLNLRRVYLRTSGFNLHNIHLNEKMGFKFEGILRESGILDEERVDVVIMSLLAPEFFRLYRFVERPDA